MASSSVCDGNKSHSFTIVLQKNFPMHKGEYFNYCVRCGKEEALPIDMCVYDMTHNHDYTKYCWTRDGFYIFRCSYYGCESLMRLWKNYNSKNDYHYNTDTTVSTTVDTTKDSSVRLEDMESRLTNEDLELRNILDGDNGDNKDNEMEIETNFVISSVNKKSRIPYEESQQMELV